MCLKQLLVLSMLFFLRSSVSECLRFTRSVSNSKNKQHLMLAPALMLTTFDSISLIYPKELGYAKDFLHTIYKIDDGNSSKSNNKRRSILRIEDAVYDNRTWSIYFIVSNSSGGSEIIQITHLVPYYRKKMPLKNDSNKLTNQSNSGRDYQIASNWIRTVIYTNSSSKILSLDINVKKRKLYWFEFNKINKKWSIGTKRLHRPLLGHFRRKQRIKFRSMRIKYFTFEDYSVRNMFTNDGYTFISIAQDNSNFKNQNDVTLFITNNQTLNICFLINSTCEDYFQAPLPISLNKTETKTSITNEPQLIENTKNMKNFNFYEDNYLNFDDLYEYEDYLIANEESQDLELASQKFNSSKITNEISSTFKPPVSLPPPIFKFGRLTGLNYDPFDHYLYLSDYGSDRIERITFESKENLKFKHIESILKTEYGQQAPLNPLMSVFWESFIFWIDFEEGLKTTVYKSSCVRTIYKIKDTTSLKFIQIGTFQKQDTNVKASRNRDNNNKNSIHVLNRLVSLQEAAGSKFKYPPDYYFYNNNNNQKEDFFDNLDQFSIFQKFSQEKSGVVYLSKPNFFEFILLFLLNKFVNFLQI